MHSLRLAGIPMDHLVAELAAFPLASETALALGLIRLDPTFSTPAPVGGDCQRLWRAAEQQLLGHFPAFSIEEAVAIRDAVWFDTGVVTPVPLHTYLRRLAGWFLEVRGDVAVPRLPPDLRATRPDVSLQGALARERWRWLALAMPPDLLLAALGDASHGPERIELVSPLLEQHLCDQQYAETHLHLGAAHDFSLLWVSTIHTLADPHLMQHEALCSPGAGCDDGRQLTPWLIRAAVARYLLAAFLFHGHWHVGFRGYLESIEERLIRQLLPANFSMLQHGLHILRSGQLSAADCRAETHARWKGLYAEITGIMGQAATRGRSAEVGMADPLVSLLVPRRLSNETAERRFIATALAYLEYAASTPETHEDVYFAQLFWQVMRVRTLFYRHIVQRPMTPGLTWFVRFYGRLSPARQLLTDHLQLQSAASLGGAGRGLRSLEVRTSPPTSIAEVRNFVDTVEQVAQSVSGAEREPDNVPRAAVLASRTQGGASKEDGALMYPKLELGLVFHFTKDRGGGARVGLPTAHWRGSHADPLCLPNDPHSGNPSAYRYARYYLARRQEAYCLAWFLRHYPLALEIVRGLDVCTDEIGVPTWVLAPLLTYVRTIGEMATAVVQHRYGVSLPGLRTTVHAGEDFVHLLTGLRQVDEAIEGFPLRAGDRIGHGIALGVDARDWAHRAGRIPMLCEERLFDLVWEWSWYGRGGACPEPGRHQYLDREIAVLSEQVFGRPITPYALESLRRDLHDQEALRNVGFPDGGIPGKVTPVGRDLDSRAGRLYRYLTDAILFQQGRRPIWVDSSSEGALLAHLQAELRRKVGTCGLTIEVNPTSNLLIGNLGDLTAHPLWRLRPPRPREDMPPVSICVGSDDPVVFGSNLRQEYQALYDAMMLAGLSDEEARQWLDRTRACGLETRFTLARRSGRNLFAHDAINLEEPLMRRPP
jgi:hypothetical protein